MLGDEDLVRQVLQDAATSRLDDRHKALFRFIDKVNANSPQITEADMQPLYAIGWTDEAIYYASGEFMSRKNIEYGSLTLHPDGFSHGPHPGKAEESLHQKETQELAVMFDTFHPLHVAKQALAVEDRDYYRSWVS